jgi:hypothetical protein
LLAHLLLSGARPPGQAPPLDDLPGGLARLWWRGKS